MPQLIWNMMMSMSGSWFFVVASEAISVGNTTVMLPGMGSYIAVAIEQRSLVAVNCAPAMHRSSLLPNARSKTCWSECGEHNQVAEARPLTAKTWVRVP